MVSGAMHPLPYAEDVNYWKTGKSGPDIWIQRAIKQLQDLSGTVLREAFGNDVSRGRQAHMLEFAIAGDTYKVLWPVLPTRGRDGRAARVQAATMLYHDVKAKCISAAVLGARAAFFSYLMLPDGRTAAELAAPELAYALPSMLAGPAQPMLSGDVIDGDVREVR